MAVIDKEKQLLDDTEYIEANIIKHLNEVVARSNGEYSGYHLWDDYDPATRKRQAEQQEVRHMRCRDQSRRPYEHRLGNKPIVFAGIEIGRLIMRVPWLMPKACEGMGLYVYGKP